MTTSTEVTATGGKGPTKQLEQALHNHFIAPQDQTSPAGAGAIYLTEVTAPGSTRRADVVHIGLWQSRGAGRIDVCELKTSRSDFLRELHDPAKAEAWWPYSTAFWLVVPHLSIAGPDDLPEGWGLLVPSGRGRRFKTVVKPAERDPRIDIPLLLTLLKNTETTRTNALQQLRTEHVRDSYQREQELRKKLASASDSHTRERLALLDRIELHLGRPVRDFVWESDAITPQTAARVLKEYAAGAVALDQARDDLRHRAIDLDSLAVEIARHAQQLRTAAGIPHKQDPAAAALAAKEA